MRQDGIWNHWQIDCYSKHMFRLISKKHESLHFWWLVDSQHKGSVTWETFPCHVIMTICCMHHSMVIANTELFNWHAVYPKKYAHGFVVLCFVVVMQSFIVNSHEVFIHIHQGCFAGTGAIVRLPQCQWSKPDGYGKISLCITTTKHSKAKTVCIFLGINCSRLFKVYWIHYWL